LERRGETGFQGPGIQVTNGKEYLSKTGRGTKGEEGWAIYIDLDNRTSHLRQKVEKE